MVWCFSLNLRGEAWAADTNLKLIGIMVIFNYVEISEIIFEAIMWSREERAQDWLLRNANMYQRNRGRASQGEDGRKTRREWYWVNKKKESSVKVTYIQQRVSKCLINDYGGERLICSICRFPWYKDSRLG